ncbi:putative small auxin-up RNA [Helianthus annuus]|uniref:Putative SAUR-like auxin-responsive protein family n=1 Tax=Helianthus annuus TaxID=4232 RepID=A0A251TDH1_HELAN|nr:putative small auxin-up RNA [Helianthus annuus]KAJ0511573.1 putative small auxin-up RNA [Helianthus annuus]KAJ0519246.1 putative small auxin-up RNA [Helianthus annuus]
MQSDKVLKSWIKKWKKMNNGGIIPSSESCDKCCQWVFRWPLSMNEEDETSIPRDVPKGHMVVYVGKNQRRFVISVKLLKHPLFSALLDQAREEYDFSTDSRLSIPCDEDTFLSVVRCATSPHDRRIPLCL